MSPLRPLDTQRWDFQGRLSRNEVEQLAADPAVRVIQSEVRHPVDSDTWELLNEVLFPRRPEVELRVYGGVYSSLCDFSFLNHVRNVRHFSANSLMRAVGIEHFSCLGKLEKLSVGIYHLENFDFLELIPTSIKSLSLAGTKSKKPYLDGLVRFHSLSRLYLEGQQQGIEVLSELPTLEELTLRSISTKNLNYVSSLPHLWRLDIKLGGIQDFASIAGKHSIKYLELWQIRGLSDLSFISSLTGLQYLFLQSLRNVTMIPDMSKLSKLRRLHLENMKGLKDVSAIPRAPALEEFSHFSAQNIAPAQYTDLLHMSTLKSIRVGFGSQRKNESFAELALRYGKNLDAGGKLADKFVFE